MMSRFPEVSENAPFPILLYRKTKQKFPEKLYFIFLHGGINKMATDTHQEILSEILSEISFSISMDTSHTYLSRYFHCRNLSKYMLFWYSLKGSLLRNSLHSLKKIRWYENVMNGLERLSLVFKFTLGSCEGALYPILLILCSDVGA